jgi:hypothetical protein
MAVENVGDFEAALFSTDVKDASEYCTLQSA